MKILLVSDSHLYNEILENILNNVQADIIIHCGDSVFKNDDPLLKKIYTVRGNHDFDFLPVNIDLEIENYKCLITHGHYYNVYAGYEELYQYMLKNNYDICFHGHTHVPHIEHYQDKLFINPGSTMFNRGNTECGSYAIVDIHNDKIDINFYNSQTLKKIPQSLIDKDQEILNEFKELVKNFKKTKN